MKKRLISIGVSIVLTSMPVIVMASDVTALKQGGGVFSDAIEYSDSSSEESFNDGTGENNYQETPEELEFADEALVLEASEELHSHCHSGVAENIGASECTPIEYSALTEEVIKNQGILLTGNYYLTDDVDASAEMDCNWDIEGRSGVITIPLGESVHLCLNGHSLKGIMERVQTLYKSVISNAGTLTICDCQGNMGTINGGACGINNTGILKIYGGNINNNSAVNYGGGIYNSGTLELYGGNISENQAGVKGGGVYNQQDAEFKMYGGTISKNIVQANKNYNAGGGGIYNESLFEFFAGSISGNEASGSGNRGGGIWNANSGTLAMNGGEIVGNICNGISGGGVENYGSFNMTDGSIKNNRADSSGAGGVYNSSAFTMSGGEISDNTGNQGGGVQNASNGIFTMEGGKISGNHATASGGGIDTLNGKGFAIKGYIDITDNTEGKNNAASNVFFSLYDPISISGALSPESKIGVRVGGQVNTTSVNFTQGEDCINYLQNFTSDDEAMYKVKIHNADSQLMLAKERTLTYAGGYIASAVPGAITGEASPTSFYDGETFQLPGEVFTRNGYQQIGWTTDQLSCDKDWDLNDKITINRGRTLSHVYPSWELEEPQLQGNNPIDVTVGYRTEDSPVLTVEINNKSYPDVTAEYTYEWYNGTECQDINLIKDANENTYTVPTGLKTGEHAYTVKVTVNDVWLNTSRNSTMTFKVTVKSTAPAYTYYTIQATAGNHGAITPSGSISVREDTDKSFVITPDEGYEIADIVVDGTSVGKVSSYNFTSVTSDHTISVSFSKKVPETYPDGTIANPDGSFVTPEGIVIKDDGTIILKDGTEIKADTEGKKPSIDKDEIVTAPDGTVYKPDGSIMKPDGTVIDKEGNIHHTDGSIQDSEGTWLRPAKTIINRIEIKGNKVNTYLTDTVNGAAGYDYVIGKKSDLLKTKDYYRVNKNILSTITSMTYIEKGTYYAACHAWTRGKDGKKIFGQWSEPRKFEVTAETPAIPKITKVMVNKNSVTITYTKCAGATGYDIILGSKVKKVNGEYRPVEYGTRVVKNNTVTVTFKNLKKGTYYAALHAHNRTSQDNKKVFSPWSNIEKIIIK